MRLGLLLPTRDRLLDGAAGTTPLLDLAMAAEDAGLDSLWVGDSPLARPRHDALTLLAAVAARTRRIQLGTAVLLAPLRHPLLVLHQAATVDLVSEGRLTLGLGAGFPLPQTEAQFGALEADYAGRTARLEDTVGLARHLWERRSGPFTGRTVAIDEPELAPAPHRLGGPPLWLAGGGPAALRRVGTLADGWLPYAPTPEAYGADLAIVRSAAAAADRPAVTAAFYATVCLDVDPQRAQARVAAGIERYYGLPFAAVRRVQAVFAGTPDDLVGWLDGYRRAGAEHVVVRLIGALPTRTELDHLAGVRAALSTRTDPEGTDV